jgi:hypothetical protein
MKKTSLILGYLLTTLPLFAMQTTVEPVIEEKQGTLIPSEIDLERTNFTKEVTLNTLVNVKNEHFKTNLTISVVDKDAYAKYLGLPETIKLKTFPYSTVNPKEYMPNTYKITIEDEDKVVVLMINTMQDLSDWAPALAKDFQEYRDEEQSISTFVMQMVQNPTAHKVTTKIKVPFTKGIVLDVRVSKKDGIGYLSNISKIGSPEENVTPDLPAILALEAVFAYAPKAYLNASVPLSSSANPIPSYYGKNDAINARKAYHLDQKIGVKRLIVTENKEEAENLQLYIKENREQWLPIAKEVILITGDIGKIKNSQLLYNPGMPSFDYNTFLIRGEFYAIRNLYTSLTGKTPSIEFYKNGPSFEIMVKEDLEKDMEKLKILFGRPDEPTHAYYASKWHKRAPLLLKELKEKVKKL